MKILSWNTQWCCGLDGHVSPQRILERARGFADADVLCLQEIAVNYPGLEGSPGDQLAQLQKLLPGWQLFFGAAVDEFTSAGRQRFGNVIATRLPALQVQHFPLPYPPDAGVRSMPRVCSVVTVMDARLGAVRVMTTHLEFYSKPQRMAQARALRSLHLAACSVADAPPEECRDGSPYQSKSQTPHAVLCGDFNFEPHEPEFAALTAPWAAGEEGALKPGQWHDSWHLLHPDHPQPPTFKLFDRRYGPEPIACDFMLVSDSLKPRVRAWEVDARTQASDHQPVALTLG
ncbi:endonuclease/exonuclease/phosphatase family protein [Comamonas endophytica]|uniref:Endonuclease/exonuclease/phosphatase family protein n=1 Tax=Comamonas endophytica TaxID=2949090 RepID=A0ABY6GBQ7_9BURK|nr:MULTISPECIES: endonuclease/exonuclease/phosphatase family protein [unclassified Acidovorax]MCD2513486.1 endonuclease/exonuclease/phosphatase family protein [Acidovorax sp. D4N7]UYG52499.1 endonuclease/exonuclease/phosphatase family protein [Acidovorax sp. 5MLIR]